MQLKNSDFLKRSVIGFSKKMTGFRKKDLEIFEIAKIGKYVVEYDWNSKISQSAQNISFIKKEIGFFKKKDLEIIKIAKSRKVAVECNWKMKIFKTFKICHFWKRIDSFYEKKRETFKNILGLQICRRMHLKYSDSSKRSKPSSFQKKYMKFLEEIFCFLRIAKDSNFVVECDWHRKFFSNVQNLCFLTKTMVFQKRTWKLLNMWR